MANITPFTKTVEISRAQSMGLCWVVEQMLHMAPGRITRLKFGTETIEYADGDTWRLLSDVRAAKLADNMEDLIEVLGDRLDVGETNEVE